MKCLCDSEVMGTDGVGYLGTRYLDPKLKDDSRVMNNEPQDEEHTKEPSGEYEGEHQEKLTLLI